MSSLGKLQFALREKKGGDGMENILLIGLLILNLIIIGILIYQNFMKKEKYSYSQEGRPEMLYICQDGRHVNQLDDCNYR